MVCIKFFVSIAFLLVLSGCQCTSTEEDENQQATLTPTETSSNRPDDESGSVESLPEPNAMIAPRHLAFLTPEQISNRFFQLTGNRIGYEDEYGNFYDSILQNYTAALGGIDFVNARQREQLPKVQALLVIKQLAWQYAIRIVENDLNNPTPRILTKVGLFEDKPIRPAAMHSADASLVEASELWHAQLEELYWHLYGRIPTASEVISCRELFLTLLKEQEEFVPAAWVGLTYTLLAAEEFWLR